MGTRANSSLRSKCASCGGAVGIAACTISMLISGIGIAAVGLSQNYGMSGMGGSQASTASTTLATSPPAILGIVLFLSGFWGEVILLGSFILMAYGIWSTKKVRSLGLALLGAAILFTGMYAYFSVGLQLTGSVALILSYTSAYSQRFANIVKLA